LGVSQDCKSILQNSGVLISESLSSQLTIQALSRISFDVNSGLYTYEYSFRNASGSALEASGLQMPLNGVTNISNLKTPPGWSSAIWKDQRAVSFSATDTGTIPPNYVDDGNLLPSPYQIKPGQTLSGFSFQSPNPPGAFAFFAQGFKPLKILENDTSEQLDMFDDSFEGTTTGPIRLLPTSLTLLTEPNSVRALALDSVNLQRSPLPQVALHNFSSDRLTRVSLFALNLNMIPGENFSALTAQAEDIHDTVFPLTVEYVGKVPGFDWITQVVVKLPGGTSNIGDVMVHIRLGGATSNKVLIGVAVSH
jgi:hypothetical protein